MIRSYIGSEIQVQWLLRAAATKHISHAYLFTGPRSIGKRTLAAAFAQAILCAKPDPETYLPCGICSHCRRVEHGAHPDVFMLEPPTGKVFYSIEQIREIIEKISLKPVEGTHRIFILPDAEKLTLPAMQSSLKVLEEPPKSGVIILTAASATNVLPTILSRCQEVALKPSPDMYIAQALARTRHIELPNAIEAAAQSGGIPGAAIQLLENPDLMREHERAIHTLHQLLNAQLSEKFALVDAILKAADKNTREQLKLLLDSWLVWWQKVLYISYGINDIFYKNAEYEALQRYALTVAPQSAEQFLRAIIKAQRLLEENCAPRQVLDVMLQSLPARA